VTVTGAGSLWSDIAGFNIGNSGTGTLTIAEGGIVAAPTVVIANNAGSLGTLNIGAGPGAAAAAPGSARRRLKDIETVASFFPSSTSATKSVKRRLPRYRPHVRIAPDCDRKICTVHTHRGERRPR
jgi:T5SS/PEP-CTERM-associated repeat protein